MRTAIITAAIISICAIQAGATDINTNKQGAGQNIEQKKSEIVQHIQERITNSQAEISCVKAAQSHEELKICREKYRPAQKGDNRSWNLQK